MPGRIFPLKFILKPTKLTEYPNVIDCHLLRENRGRIRRPGPVTPNGNIHYKEEWIIEWVIRSGRFQEGLE
jgi:hypothetical protein